MKKLLLLLLIGCFTNILLAQDFEVPENYKLNKAEDYAKYEQDVIKCVDWLQKTPLATQPEKRKNANKFLLAWVMGSPNVHLVISDKIVTFMEPNADLLLVFMGGWTKYALETKAFDDKVGGNLAGVEAVIDFYTRNQKMLLKDKNVEKYIEMKNKGTLKKYIAKKA